MLTVVVRVIRHTRVCYGLLGSSLGECVWVVSPGSSIQGGFSCSSHSPGCVYTDGECTPRPRAEVAKVRQILEFYVFKRSKVHAQILQIKVLKNSRLNETRGKLVYCLRNKNQRMCREN